MATLREIRRILDVLGLADRFAPGLKLVQKSAYRLHRWIGAFSEAYLTDFWTTLPRLNGSGCTIYRPSSTDTEDARNEFAVIAHELQHARQVAGLQSKVSKPLGVWAYGFLYAFPQGLALLGVLWAAVWLVCKLGGHDLPWWPAMLVVCAAPLPAPYRVKAELEAYEVSAAADYWYRGGMSALETEAWVQHVSANFTSSAYYFMAGPLLGPWVRRRLRAWFKALRTDAAETQTEYLVAVKSLCNRYRAEDGG